MKYQRKQPRIVDAEQWTGQAKVCGLDVLTTVQAFQSAYRALTDEQIEIAEKRIDCLEQGDGVVMTLIKPLEICRGHWVVTYGSGASMVLTDKYFHEHFEPTHPSTPPDPPVCDTVPSYAFRSGDRPAFYFEPNDSILKDAAAVGPQLGLVARCSGATLIAAERQRQIGGEGWTDEHDAQHTIGELAMAAACYAAPRKIYEQIPDASGVSFFDPFPWPEWDKRHKHDRIKQLVIAGALCAAELDRLRRLRSEPTNIAELLDTAYHAASTAENGMSRCCLRLSPKAYDLFGLYHAVVPGMLWRGLIVSCDSRKSGIVVEVLDKNEAVIGSATMGSENSVE